jgi:glycosidase
VPGIPCIYYGTEQALDGSEDDHDYTVEPARFGEDRYVREAMFGGPFGAFRTTGCHFFNSRHPSYLRIAAISRIRNAETYNGRTLRLGLCYPREVALPGADHFAIADAGEICAWSRLLANHEVVMALNTHGIESRSAAVTVDARIHPPGSHLRVLYRADWSDPQLVDPPTDEFLEVRHTPDGRACVDVSLPPAGLIVLGE